MIKTSLYSSKKKKKKEENFGQPSLASGIYSRAPIIRTKRIWTVDNPDSSQAQKIRLVRRKMIDAIVTSRILQRAPGGSARMRSISAEADRNGRNDRDLVTTDR